jgi:two-component system, cell cycle sensor histidine kinase and response regulator CckA
VEVAELKSNPTTPIPLRVLIVEDSDDDSELLRRELQRGGYDVTHEQVDTASAFRAALEREWDVIVCDYRMPSFSAPAAIELLGESGRDIPLIIVSGAIGEDVAVEAMRTGAKDYLLKQNLTRLVPAIRRELREAQERHARRQAERALEHAQKLESVGAFSGGIAHDFNNILTCILAGAALARRRARNDAALQKELDEITNEAQRAAGLVRQLLAFSRRQQLDRTNLDLNDVVSRLEGFFRRVMGAHIEFETRFDRALPLLNADVGQIEQVVMNLCLNARDAMQNGGILRIETRTTRVSPADCARHPGAAAGKYVTLSVSDTGHGMTPQIVEHIFDPFFTTKSPHEGTGLGLSVVYGIVKQHEGFVDVRSEPGRGTTFLVFFPIAAERRAQTAEPTRAPALVAGYETILLVEDDAGVRTALRRILDGYGYRVLAATDGEQAWQTFVQRTNEIDLVLLDVLMPKLGGRDLYDALKALKPDVNVLFVSGHGEGSIDLRALEQQGVDLLRKPFEPDELAAAVRRALDARRVEPPRPQPD